MTLKVGIIGGGVIGQGWARLLTSYGHQVRVYDQEPERQQGATTIAEAATKADLVIEAVAEREEVKLAVLAHTAATALPNALIASASSSILPSRLQAAVTRPERLLVLHPLHPVELLPIIEVVPGAQTSSESVERARELIRSLGKLPVVLKREVPGYVVNRLAAALWREALHLVLSGVIDPRELDLAASRGPCLGWAVQGPFLTYELAAPGGIGPFMEHLHPAFSAIWRDLARFDALSPAELEQVTHATATAYPEIEREEAERNRDQALMSILPHLP